LRNSSVIKDPVSKTSNQNNIDDQNIDEYFCNSVAQCLDLETKNNVIIIIDIYNNFRLIFVHIFNQFMHNLFFLCIYI
jgi:hypothetical protein